MPIDRAELLRQVLDAFNKGDVDCFVALLDPDVEWHPFLAANVEGDTEAFRGHQGVRAWLRTTQQLFSEVDAEAADFRELGPYLVALGRLRGRFRDSGAEVTAQVGWVIEVGDDDTVVRGWAFPSHAEALRVAEQAE